MSDVVSLSAHREARTPHGEGMARCLDCRHEWRAVAPVGTAQLDCPACHGHRAFWKHPYGPVEGDKSFACSHCGAEHFYAVKRAGLISLKCAGCGVDHTMDIWEAR